MKRTLTASILFILIASAAAHSDIYRRKSVDGTVTFTDTPTTSDYELVIREGPEVLPWREYARIQADRSEIDPELVEAVIYVESGEKIHAVSPKGAKGLMQLMDGTAEELGVEDPMEPRQNVRGGVLYLAALIEKFDGNIEHALAAYNAGPGAVEKFGGVPPYPETENFVKRVLEIYRAKKN
ncbi:MAG: lytic transglycosylase [Deltaproteobacteria bacterium]|nr:MAG: lytic transglycosylase [Deltaproteobacteria bacterium]